MPGAGTGGSEPTAGTGGTGPVVVDTCGNGTCDLLDNALGCPWECRPASCGDGVCTSADYDFHDGNRKVADFPECHAECPATCGNGVCDAIHDTWQGCPEECEVKPPEPIVLCPYPAWASPLPATFVNPYHPNVPHISWTVGDKVERTDNGKCYQCTDYECKAAPPSTIPGEPWQPIPCDC
jgi:hypothetical protein